MRMSGPEELVTGEFDSKPCNNCGRPLTHAYVNGGLCVACVDIQTVVDLDRLENEGGHVR